MDDLSTNLATAWEAVRFVKGKMRFGAKNKVKDLWKSGGRSWDALDDQRADEDRYVQSLSGQRESGNLSLWTATERLIEFRASAAATGGAGNCAEQAALAFIYLRDKGVFPIDYVFKPNWVFGLTPFGGHALVVVGRTKGPDNAPPSTWGNTAAIADPHGEEIAFPISKMDSYYPKTTFVSMFRQETKSQTAIRVRF